MPKGNLRLFYVMLIKILQLVVTAIAIAGTALVFYNSPFVKGTVSLPTFAEGNERMAKAKRQRRRARLGFLLILVSYVLQVVVVFL
jgi:hypothetical protein